MLDFIYYPVSFILWCWHRVFGAVLGPTNFIGWALSIVFLVFTLRLVLLRPAIHQVRSMRKMQEFQPEIKKIQKKYAKDRQRQAAEMQKLQRENGFNPMSGCLPMVLQIPVFIGLNHVLRSFHQGISNYFFKPADVDTYLHGSLFGVHLGDSMFGTSFNGMTSGFHWNIAPVAIPLMIVASVATHFTARLSVQRQQAMGQTGNAQAAMMSKITLWVFPLGVLIFGAGFQIGLLLYWLSNNVWTLAQQHFVFQRMDREEAQKKAVAVEKSQALAPKPGQKPVQPKNRRPAAGAIASGTARPADGASDDSADGASESATEAKETTGPQGSTGKTNAARRAPAKGAANKGNTNKGTANGRPRSGTEIPGLISDRSQRKKQDRKRS
ncbi:MAG TPA: membrane protein insertase YidC [Pseudonocardiaceae bacterium]|nr:membrane protein insertase YidC [Pseudonocardiaceae bacterium]